MKKFIQTRDGLKQNGEPWRIDEYLFIVPGRYEHKYPIEVSGVERCKQWKEFFDGMPDKNAPVKIQFEIDSNERDGRYFIHVQAWDICITEW